MTYYFQNEKPSLAVAARLPWMLALAAAAGDGSGAPAVRHHGGVLHAAVCDLLDFIGEQYLGLKDEPPETVMRRMAADQLLDEEVARASGSHG